MQTVRKLLQLCLLLSCAAIMITIMKSKDFHMNIPSWYSGDFMQAASKRETLVMVNRLWQNKPKQSTAAPPPNKPRQAWDISSTDCRPNLGLQKLKWFQGLEARFKEFLLYRHCRLFPMVMNHPGKCEGDIDLLIAIKSTITQHDRRELIRKTWGKEQNINGMRVRTVFLLGTASNEEERVNHQKLLEYEDYIFQDILQWDFTDSFFNLTLKETHFLKWFSMHCPSVRHVFKGDDDMFVNIPNLFEYIKENRGQDLFVGDVMFNARPIRSPKSKYFIPVELYKEQVYPPYAGGGGFLMDGKLVPKLYEASTALELYPIDDVFLGMCLQRIDVKPVKHNAFKTLGLVKNKASALNREPCFYKSLIVVHKLLPPELTKMWRLVNSELVCTYKLQIFTLDQEGVDSE